MPDSVIRPGQLCVAFYSSDYNSPEEWHRAKIVNIISENMVCVNLVDFGTVTILKKKQLRFLRQAFKFFPVQSIAASLAGITPLPGHKEWPLNTCTRFLELLRTPHLEAEVVDIDYRVDIVFRQIFCYFQSKLNNS